MDYVRCRHGPPDPVNAGAADGDLQAGVGGEDMVSGEGGGDVDGVGGHEVGDVELEAEGHLGELGSPWDEIGEE